MGVILSESTHPHQTMHGSGLLIPIYGTQLSPAERQVPIGTLAVLVNHDMERTVHRLDIVVALVHLHRRIHAFLVETQVTAGLPKP
ncbi:hypothetical protein SDC9_202194 [bioreactor metagenome]|uniref:Uncharacterized protein n=1 Tax=bioreactor metagenome TaxID=1076179 RepID=A0A645J1Z6_9ZZZZ